MQQAVLLLLGLSIVVFFGFFAEFVFKKTRIPDILLLILFGFVIGPYGLGYISPQEVAIIAPVFTTFTLLFLLYEGAFHIDLASFFTGFNKSIQVTLYNFIISSAIVTFVMRLFGFPLLTSLLTGFILGGLSSAYVIPLLKQMNVSEKVFSILTLESALTDVLCIVSALTVVEVFKLEIFNPQVMFTKIASLFAIAGLLGIVAGIIWIILVTKVFKEHKSYMITIAYLILVYVVTEYLNGNGAIAALFFGLILKNSERLARIFSYTVKKCMVRSSKKPLLGVAITTSEEQFFYAQISFLLKTFFFVYIGILLNIKDTKAIIIAGILSVAIMIARSSSSLLFRGYDDYDRKIINSIFARGLAAAAIAQLVTVHGIKYSSEITHITYGVISFTVILSSVRVFFVKMKRGQKPTNAVRAG